jgi:branched-chain amino acid transport system permease protein
MSERSLPSRASLRRAVVAVALLALLLYPVLEPEAAYPQTVLLMAFLLAVMAMSWNIISGFAGYISLGHSAFLGLGAYTAGILSVRWGINPLYLVPLGGLVAAATAVGVGAVVLRARGHAFVIITIALLLALQVCAVNFSGITNGSDGITLPLPAWPPRLQNIPFYYLFLALMLVTFAFSAWIRRTKFGTGLVAIREDEGKAAAIGVSTTTYKVLGYAASAVFIGMAGAVYAYFLTFLNPVGAFSILVSVTIVLAALVGGRGTIWGPLIGAFVVQILSEVATVEAGGSGSRLLMLGLALVLVVLFLPAGLVPTIASLVARRRARGASVEFLQQAAALRPRPLEVHHRVPPSAERAGRPLLEIRGVARRFGGLVAVDGVDLDVAEGSITGLIGPNGSGKTTLFNLVTGSIKADRGEIVLDGERIDRMPPWRRAHCGLGRTFQVTRLFGGMTVLENVVAPLPAFRWRTLGADAVTGPEALRARELLDAFGLARFADQAAGTLSYGQQKLVELAQVLMLQPRLILLDEPAGGVNPGLVERIAGIVRELNRQGMTFLVVEHDIPLVLQLCDPVAVLSAGRLIAQGPPEAVRSDPVVLEAYLGADAEPAAG